MTGVRALGSLVYLRVSERDERSRRFGMSERAWLEHVDRRGLSGRRNETSEGCRESLGAMNDDRAVTRRRQRLVRIRSESRHWFHGTVATVSEAQLSFGRADAAHSKPSRLKPA
jgi:hypothetical protein